MDSLHTEPVMRKMCPCHEATMISHELPYVQAFGLTSGALFVKTFTCQTYCSKQHPTIYSCSLLMPHTPTPTPTHSPTSFALQPLSFLCMMTSSNGNIFRATGHLCGEFTGPRWIPPPPPPQTPVTRSFDVFFDLCLNKRLSKQSWGWWFETLSRPLRRHRDGPDCYLDTTLFSP